MDFTIITDPAGSTDLEFPGNINNNKIHVYTINCKHQLISSMVCNKKKYLKFIDIAWVH